MAAAKASSKASASKRRKEKAMKAKTKTQTKTKQGSKIARGRLARSLVLREAKEKTVGGLTSKDLVKNKRGKVVSKKVSAAGMIRYRNIKPWLMSIMEARRALQVKGFVAINGKTMLGKALYITSKKLCAKHAAHMQRTKVENPGHVQNGSLEEKCKVESA